MMTIVKMNKRVVFLPENNDHGHIGLSVHLVTAELGDHLEELGEEMSDTNPSFGLVQAEYLEESC